MGAPGIEVGERQKSYYLFEFGIAASQATHRELESKLAPARSTRRRARESARRATDFTSCAAIRYAKGVLGLGDEDASTPAAQLSFIGGRAAVAFDTIWVAPKTAHPKSSCKIKRSLT